MIRRPPRSTRTDTTLSLHDALPISYVPGKAASDDGRKLAKLSANENPLGTSPKAREAFMAATADLATYPDPAAAALREGIAAQYGLDPARVIYGTGSDELQIGRAHV